MAQQFDKKSLSDMKEMHKIFKSAPKNQAVQTRARYPVGAGGAGDKFARTKDLIPGIAMSGDPGKGPGKLQNWNPNASPTFNDGPDVDLYNPVSQSIPKDALVVVSLIDGFWVIIVADCQ